MGSLSASFPHLTTRDGTYHVVRGGFDFMIPSSSPATAEITIGGVGPKRFSVSGEGLTIPGTDQQFAAGSWSLDVWAHFDFLFTPHRCDMWINSTLTTSRVVQTERLATSLSVGNGCEVDDFWVAGGDVL